MEWFYDGIYLVVMVRSAKHMSTYTIIYPVLLKINLLIRAYDASLQMVRM